MTTNAIEKAEALQREADAKTVANYEKEFHPAANCFPLMTEKEFADLCDSMKVQGQLDPIVRDDHTQKIVDGRNRYLACMELGLDCQEIVLPFKTEEELQSYVIAKNIARRHLSVTQKAFAAAALATLANGQRQDRACSQEQGTPKTTPDAAAQLGVGASTARRARTVNAKGTEAVKEAAKAEKISLNTAEIIARLPAEQQKPALEAALNPPKREKPKATAKPKDPVTEAAKIDATKTSIEIAPVKETTSTIIDLKAEEVTIGDAVSLPTKINPMEMSYITNDHDFRLTDFSRLVSTVTDKRHIIDAKALVDLCPPKALSRLTEIVKDAIDYLQLFVKAADAKLPKEEPSHTDNVVSMVKEQQPLAPEWKWPVSKRKAVD